MLASNNKLSFGTDLTPYINYLNKQFELSIIIILLITYSNCCYVFFKIMNIDESIMNVDFEANYHRTTWHDILMTILSNDFAFYVRNNNTKWPSWSKVSCEFTGLKSHGSTRLPRTPTQIRKDANGRYVMIITLCNFVIVCSSS